MKRLQHRIGALLLAAVALGALAGRADAISENAIVRNVPYVIAFKPMYSGTVPFTGVMKLTFNNGIVSGTYTDDSIKPGGPFANRRNVYVSGGISGQRIDFTIGPIGFHGIFYGNTIAGSAIIRGRIYEFEAQRGMPGHKMTDRPT